LTDDHETMGRRYARAVGWTPPKLAARSPGAMVEGYWLDARHYFFLVERTESSPGRSVTVPGIADCESRSVREVVSLDALADLLFKHLGHRLDPAALSAAEFAMPDRNTLGVRVGGWDYLIDAVSLCVISPATSPQVPALYSPNGRSACFVKGCDLWLRELDTGAERPLTPDGSDHHCYGQQSEAGLSAVAYRGRPLPAGLWSPDSQWFLTHRVDERALPELALIQHAPPGGGRPALHRFRYPMPGDPLPIQTYVAIHVASGRQVTFENAAGPLVMPYLPFARTAWFGRADEAWFVRFDRYFTRADLVCLDLRQGSAKVVLSETAASGYIDLHSTLFVSANVRTICGSNEVIWYSERDGWGHLYLYDITTGRLKNQITRGAWQVRDLVHVDEEQRKVLFLAAGVDPQQDPAQRVLCSVHFDGSGFQLLRKHEGDIHIAPTEPCGLEQHRRFRPSAAQPGFSPDGRFGVIRHSSIDQGNRTEVVDLHSGESFPIAHAQPRANEPPVRKFTALAADGRTPLHGVMFLPSDFEETRLYPLIDYIYPGPQVAWQPQSFRAVSSAHARALAELGIVTLMFDTRGMPIGSRAFHQAGYGGLIEPQLSDHVAVVRQLCEQHAFLDETRIGMLGYSGGGYATAQALFSHGDIFKVGVAACGNHDASLYTSMWSDKYRGPPGTWADQASGARAGALKGKLLLISGDMDENVHLSQTLSLVDALIRQNKDFDLLIVPNEGHAVMMNSGYAIRRTWDYFVRHLLGGTPPDHFQIHFEPHELACWMDKFRREIR
jgi:dipeptidyl-peptidase 4